MNARQADYFAYLATKIFYSNNFNDKADQILNNSWTLKIWHAWDLNGTNVLSRLSQVMKQTDCELVDKRNVERAIISQSE